MCVKVTKSGLSDLLSTNICHFSIPNILTVVVQIPIASSFKTILDFDLSILGRPQVPELTS